MTTPSPAQIQSLRPPPPSSARMSGARLPGLRARLAGVCAGAFLALLSGCGGSDGGTSCALGQVWLESGCTDTAKAAEQVRLVVRETMKELDLRSAIVSVSVG